MCRIVRCVQRRKYYAFWRQFNEKPSIIPGCAGRLCSFLQVGQALAVDLTAEEECCTSAALQVAVNAKGHLCAVSQRGSAGINPGIMQVSKLHCSRHRQHSPLAYDMACSMCNIEAGEYIDEGVRYEQLC